MFSLCLACSNPKKNTCEIKIDSPPTCFLRVFSLTFYQIQINNPVFIDHRVKICGCFACCVVDEGNKVNCMSSWKEIIMNVSVKFMVCLFSKVICVFLLNQNDSIDHGKQHCIQENWIFKKVDLKTQLFCTSSSDWKCCFPIRMSNNAYLPIIESVDHDALVDLRNHNF